MPHNFAIQKANPDGSDWVGQPPANGGQTATYQPPPLKAGTYTFFCSHPSQHERHAHGGSVAAWRRRRSPQAGAYGRSRSAWVYEWVTTTDHKKIGAMYVTTAFGFFLVGGILALLHPQRARGPGLQFLSAETYNQLFTIHGTDDDLPVRDADDHRPRELHRAAPDRRRGHGLPAHQRAVVLDGPAGRPAALLRRTPFGGAPTSAGPSYAPLSEQSGRPASTCVIAA